MKGLHIDPDRAARLGAARPDRGRVHRGGRRPRPGHAVRRHRLRRHRRADPWRRHRLARPQARPHDRCARRGRDRDRRRPRRSSPARPSTRTCSGRFAAAAATSASSPASSTSSTRSAMILGGALFMPADRDVLRGLVPSQRAPPRSCRRSRSSSPPRRCRSSPAEHDRQAVAGHRCSSSTAIPAGQAALEPFRAVATPLVELAVPMPYPGIYQFTAEGREPRAGVHRSASSTRSTTTRSTPSSTRSPRPRPRHGL